MNKYTQKGATLIVVLVLLVVITVIGTMAIRQSMVSLSVATNAQVQQLLVQNSDAALYRIEDQKTVVRNLARDGMFGYLRGVQNKNKELVFCYRADQSNLNFFQLTRASIVEWASGDTAPKNTALGNNGFCQISSSGTNNFFTSGRKLVMTQVAVKYSTVANDQPFKYSARGTDTKSAKIDETEKVNVYSVSVMPALSTASTTDINACLRNKMNEVTVPESDVVVTIPADSTVSVTACLTELNVPFTTQVSEYTIVQAFN